MYEGDVRALANAKALLARVQGQIQALMEQIEAEHPELEELHVQAAEAAARAKALDQQLREKIANRYELFDEDPDHPALSLRQYSAPQYKEESALILSVDHRLYGLVRLDRKAFEKVAPYLWPMLGDWAHKRITATITKDLSEWEGEDPDGEAEEPA